MLLSAAIMFMCEQVADVAIMTVLGYHPEVIMEQKHKSVSESVAREVILGYVNTELLDHEYVNYVYDECVREKSDENV